MSVRVSESWTTCNGHRRTVSMGLGTYLLAGFAWCLARGVIGLFVLLPFFLYWWSLLACAWVCAEMVLFTVTGTAVIAAVLRHEATGADITLRRGKWNLVAVGLKGER